MDLKKFETIDYLRSGNPKQRRAYDLLTYHAVFDTLAPFDPLLAGTVPIGIDIETSDLDIICCWREKASFRKMLKSHFGDFNDFQIKEKQVRGYETVISRFELDHFPVEIFGQHRPSREQEAFRHMVVEHQILCTREEGFRQKIINLKRQGYKTEPAFAKVLGLRGDPYEAILNYNPF